MKKERSEEELFEKMPVPKAVASSSNTGSSDDHRSDRNDDLQSGGYVFRRTDGKSLYGSCSIVSVSVI